MFAIKNDLQQSKIILKLNLVNRKIKLCLTQSIETELRNFINLNESHILNQNLKTGHDSLSQDLFATEMKSQNQGYDAEPIWHTAAHLFPQILILYSTKSKMVLVIYLPNF